MTNQEIRHKCPQEDTLSTLSLQKQGSLLDENQEEDWSLSNQGQRKRRGGIHTLLTDDSLVPVERRRTMQSLMNERHCPSSRSGLRLDVESAKCAELKRPECLHYDRACSIISPCCGEVFGCRICHDECSSLPDPITANRDKNQIDVCCSSSTGTCNMSTKMNDAQNHKIDRFAIAEVICRVCYTQQSSKTNDCINCHTKFGEYHCETCNLWMSNDENPYHCSDCGFCRIGGDDAFVHCHDCEMCVYASQFEKHDCKKDKYKSNCPICQECMFDSRKKTHEMPCGHALHWDCFLELTKHDSRCPLCKKTAESEKRMAATWKFMALNIVFNPIPCEMAKVVDIYCNDCETHQSNRPWHPVGIQCQSCVSFNTFIEKVTATGPASHSFLQNQESM